MDAAQIRSLRSARGFTQRQLAASLGVDVALVRDWESGLRFPTRAHCTALARLTAPAPAPAPSPAPTGESAASSSAAGPYAVLADPRFQSLYRKLLAHAALREQATALADAYPDPAASTKA